MRAVFGQSMHLLVEDALTSDEIRAKLQAVRIQEVEIHPIGPSLEDVFVSLTAKYSNHGAEEKAA